MYSVLMKKEASVPILMSDKNIEYNDYLLSGYEEIYSGTMRECKDVIDEIISTTFE
jgi:hypothetical protein